MHQRRGTWKSAKRRDAKPRRRQNDRHLQCRQRENVRPVWIRKVDFGTIKNQRITTSVVLVIQLGVSEIAWNRNKTPFRANLWFRTTSSEAKNSVFRNRNYFFSPSSIYTLISLTTMHYFTRPRLGWPIPTRRCPSPTRTPFTEIPTNDRWERRTVRTLSANSSNADDSLLMTHQWWGYNAAAEHSKFLPCAKIYIYLPIWKS